MPKNTIEVEDIYALADALTKLAACKLLSSREETAFLMHMLTVRHEAIELLKAKVAKTERRGAQ